MSKFGIKNLWNIRSSTPTVDTTNLAKTNEANTFTAENTFNANVLVQNGNNAGIYTAKDITNDNDNQVINYKAYYWKRAHTQSSIVIDATNGIKAYDITTSDLKAQRHIKVMLRFAPSNYDYTVVFDLTCNSLSYKNQGEVKFIHWGDNTVSTLDISKLLCVSVAQYGTNKLRVNLRNIGTERITTGQIFTYIQMVKPVFQR